MTGLWPPLIERVKSDGRAARVESRGSGQERLMRDRLSMPAEQDLVETANLNREEPSL